MQIIQGIREKGAALVIGIIALSLIGFILMDANKKSFSDIFGTSGRNPGKVNGSTISIEEYNKRVNTSVKKEEQSSQQGVNSSRLSQIRQQTWDQLITERIFFAEADKLGIGFTGKELGSILSSNDPSNPFSQDQQMKGANGQLDVEKVKQAIAQIKKMKEGEQKDMVYANYIDPTRLQTEAAKYTGMLNASVYYPKWMKEKDKREQNNYAQINYVNIPYNVIGDSLVTVSDDEIKDYVNKKKDMYKQEAGRMLSYVKFSMLPNLADTNETRENVAKLKEKFISDTNARAFVAKYTSSIQYFDGYTPKKSMQMAAKDSITMGNQGHVFGPYLDGGAFVLSKIVEIKTMPDSIKCRHILLGTVDPQTQQPKLDDSVAHQKADSVANAIKNGADFVMLSNIYSSDETAKKSKGEMTFDIVTIQNPTGFAPEFAAFLLNDKGETKRVVKTNFGWHYIEILEKKNPAPAYKVAYMAKNISASEKTITDVTNAATKLYASCRDIKALDAYVAKNGLQKITHLQLVKENDNILGELQEAGELIRWAFDAKKGEVSDRNFSLGNNLVVAAVDKIFEEGIMDAQTARPQTETIIRNKKKAEMIIKKIPANVSLDSAAAIYGKTVDIAGQDSSILYSASFISKIGAEPKLLGAIFNKDNTGKVTGPIAGTNGVYLVKVNSINTKPDGTPEQEEQKVKAKMQDLRGKAVGDWFTPLRKQADIKDNRAKMHQ